MSRDTLTAQAFASSWNNLPPGTVYTHDQFVEWMDPIQEGDVSGKRVLELGCGNGSLMVHMTKWNPSFFEGVDLGDSVIAATQNLAGNDQVQITQSDLVSFNGTRQYDFVYCIGVLHHLKNPYAGFESVIRNTKSGGKFHCWVYAYEGNALIRYVVDPLRSVTCKFPWWLTKYGVATPLSAVFYVYAKTLARLARHEYLHHFPLYEYALWIAKRDFAFFRHVAFDQLVTPQTAYLSRETVEHWLQHRDILIGSTYLVMRNGNSWKFGGIKK